MMLGKDCYLVDEYFEDELDHHIVAYRIGDREFVRIGWEKLIYAE